MRGARRALSAVDEAVDDLLFTGVFEIDDQLVAVDLGDLAVAELDVEGRVRRASGSCWARGAAAGMRCGVDLGIRRDMSTPERSPESRLV